MMSIIINVRELAARTTPLELERSIPLQHLVKNAKDIVKAEPLNLHLQATAQSGMITVRGHCSADVDFICSRTLVQFTDEVAFEYLQEFTTFQTKAMEDEDIELIQGETLNLTPYLEEQFLLHLPFIPVCKEVKDTEAERLLQKYTVRDSVEEDVKDDASTSHIDPRLAGLKDFFKK